MIRGHHIPEPSKMRRTIVMLVWSSVVFLMFLNKEKINMSTVNTFVHANLQAIATTVWYGMVAATSFMTCLFSRAMLKTFNKEEAGSIMAVIFNVVLATTISLNVDDISFKSKNTPVDAMILCAAAGYYLYETFFFRLADYLQDRYKALGVIALTSFIINCLHNTEGASVQLLFLFLFSSPIPIMKLPSFGSAKYVDSVAYRCSVWAAYLFTLHQRLIVGLGLTFKLWTVSEFRLNEYETPLWVSIYCIGMCGTYYFLEVVNKRQQKLSKKEKEEKNKILKCDEKLASGKLSGTVRGGRAEGISELKRKVVHAYE